MGKTPATIHELQERMQAGWEDFRAYLDTLTPEQLTMPTDTAGWTAKDHIVHLAVWEDGIEGLLTGASRQARMGVDDATWKYNWHSDDYFRINDAIFQQHKHLSLDEALKKLEDVHERMMKAVESLSDDDLKRPYRSFDPQSKRSTAIIEYIVGDSYQHYKIHRPWIAAIVNRE